MEKCQERSSGARHDGALNRDERKSFAKTKRTLAKVTKELGIVSLERPSKVLLICNAGLMTGTSHEEIMELFSAFGSVADICLMPGKAFSFLAFSDLDSSKRAFESVHGKPRGSTAANDVTNDSGDGGRVLYLSYVDRMPERAAANLASFAQRWRSQDQWPRGLNLVHDFISQEEENALMASLTFEEGMKHRQVQHFGYEFRYDTNNIGDRTRPFPETWMPVLRRALDRGYLDVMPDQCTVNRYEAGQGIPPHVDTHSCCTHQIASLSLQAEVVMDFQDLSESAAAAAFSVRLPVRSLMIMSDETRYAYSHGITPRKHDIVPNGGGEVDRPCGLTLLARQTRVSLTFRKTRGDTVPRQCLTCGFPQFCDSQKDARVVMDDSKARALESAHVHQVYEEIADHFSHTRHSPWPQVLNFVDTLAPASFLIDVGCGNGKYLSHNDSLVKVGCDYSQGLLSICRQRGFQAVRCDALKLPYRDSVADGCMSIAVIHHLSTLSRRKSMIQEIHRVLKPGGKALIYAWAQDQERDATPSSYLRQGGATSATFSRDVAVATQLQQQEVQADFPMVLPVHKNRTKFEHTDLLVPWKTKEKSEGQEKAEVGEKTYHRYYHVFEENELERLIESVQGLQIEHTYYDQGNWCAVFVKL